VTAGTGRQRKNKLKLKNLLNVLGILLVLYTGWLLFLVLNFHKPNAMDQDISGFEIQGVFHVHTKYSDGWRPLEKVVDFAAGKSLDFLILTDHGNPNVPSFSSQGWQKNVLILAGSEVSVNRGHLVALNFKMPSGKFSHNAEQVSHQVKNLGGFTVISHPFSKVSWSWGREGVYSGLEIVNADTMFRKDFFRSLPYLPALALRPSFALLKSLDRPVKNLRKWDELNKTGTMYGYFSIDAHVFYRSLFSLLHIHVLLDKPFSSEFKTARQQVFDSLGRGDFYNAVEAAAPAGGFRFFGRKEEENIPMGSQAAFAPGISLHVMAPFSFQKETRVIADGQTVFTSSDNRFVFVPKKPGVYRVEVYLKKKSPLAKNFPWIVSNPIFLRMRD